MNSSRIGRMTLLAAAVILAASLSAGSALAYFTTFCSAEGGVVMNMGFTTTEMQETVDSGKHITISNTGDYDCFVRARAYAPDGVALTYSGENWEYDAASGWYEYTEVLVPGGTTLQLDVSYTHPAGEDAPDEYNIVVVYECSPVFYTEDGTPEGNWDFVVAEGSQTQEGE